VKSRPDWKVQTKRNPIDLSANVHYDQILDETVKNLSFKNILDYPDQYKLYACLSEYHDIPLKNLTIGYGSGDIIFRIIQNFVTHLYIVEPTFAMVSVYCDICNVPYTKITIDELYDLPKDSEIYVANPNGNNGEAYDLSGLDFLIFIVDEAYAEFYPKYSMLQKDKNGLFVVKTLSKSLGLAGLRVGYCKATERDTYKLQQTRNNFVTSSFAVEIVPQVIHMMDDVVNRMLETKEFLESKYDCQPSHGNYVLFKSPNILTDTYGYKLIDNQYYRMALTNKEIILCHLNSKKGT
jgi:histidinol-phosphate aminotransferase